MKSIAELVGADSLLSASQQHHKLIRGRLFPLFSSTSLASFVELFDQLVVEAMSGWTRHDSVVVIQHEALKVRGSIQTFEFNLETGGGISDCVDNFLECS